MAKTREQLILLKKMGIDPDSVTDGLTEICVNEECRKDTGIDVRTNVADRMFHIEGIGQFCNECGAKNSA